MESLDRQIAKPKTRLVSRELCGYNADLLQLSGSLRESIRLTNGININFSPWRFSNVASDQRDTIYTCTINVARQFMHEL